MKHRLLKVAAVSVALTAGAVSAVNMVQPTQQVQAISKYSHKWHWAHSIKEVHIYKVKVGKYMYLSKLIDEGYIPKGYSFKIRYSGHDYPWQLKKMGAGLGGHIVVLRHNASWFRNGYKKPPMAN